LTTFTKIEGASIAESKETVESWVDKAKAWSMQVPAREKSSAQTSPTKNIESQPEAISDHEKTRKISVSKMNRKSSAQIQDTSPPETLRTPLKIANIFCIGLFIYMVFQVLQTVNEVKSATSDSLRIQVSQQQILQDIHDILSSLKESK